MSQKHTQEQQGEYFSVPMTGGERDDNEEHHLKGKKQGISFSQYTATSGAKKFVLLFVLGLCFNTYHLCTANKVDLIHGDVLHGTCEAPSAASTKVSKIQTNTTQVASIPSGLWPLLELIVAVVERSVWGYFVTFILCWNSILSALITMIDRYITFLGHLVNVLTEWPTNIIFVFGVAVSLGGAALILQIVLTHFIPSFKGWTLTNNNNNKSSNKNGDRVDGVEATPKAEIASQQQ